MVVHERPEAADTTAAAQRAELEALAARQQVTVRVDADVLAWLRSAGRGYQSKLNGILRKAMIRAVGSLPPKRVAQRPKAPSDV